MSTGQFLDSGDNAEVSSIGWMKGGAFPAALGKPADWIPDWIRLHWWVGKPKLQDADK